MPGISHRSHPLRIARIQQGDQISYAKSSSDYSLQFTSSVLWSFLLLPQSIQPSCEMQRRLRAPLLTEQDIFKHVLSVSACVALVINGIT